MRPFELLEPTSLEEACRCLAERGEGAKLIGGGTALVVLMKQKVFQPQCLISTRRIPELQAFRFSPEEGLTLGGGVRHFDIESSPVVRERYPLLAAAVHKVGNIRVRQMATLGGNLSHCDYMSDPPAALIALGARVVLASTSGTREMPLEEFILGPYTTQLQPGEILAAVRVPPPVPGALHAYVKFAIPTETERPTVTVAVQVVPEDGAVRDAVLVVGAVTGRPRRVEVRELLVGHPLTPERAEQAAEAAVADLEPIDDGRTPVWYKRDVTRVMVRRALERVAAQMNPKAA